MAIDPFLSSTISKSITSSTGEKSGGFSSVTDGGAENSPFKNVMNSMGSQEDLAASIGIDPSDLTPAGPQFSTINADALKPQLEFTQTESGGKHGKDLVVDLLQEVNQGQMKMDYFTNEILNGGKKFSQNELIAIQARIYHFSQITELTVKVAQEGVSSTKTILSTQVQ